MRIILEQRGAGGPWSARSPDLPGLLVVDGRLEAVCADLPRSVRMLRRAAAGTRTEAPDRGRRIGEAEVVAALGVMLRRLEQLDDRATTFSYGSLYLVAARGEAASDIQRLLERHLRLGPEVPVPMPPGFPKPS